MHNSVVASHPVENSPFLAGVSSWPALTGFLSDLGYHGIHQENSHRVPLAVYWKREVFDLVWCEERSRAVLCEFATSGFKNGERPSAPTQIYVVNVHLEGSPFKGSTRVSQLRHALHRLENRFAQNGTKTETARVIVVGDFNSQRHDSPCRLLEDGWLDAKDDVSVHRNSEGNEVPEISHPFNFVEAYSVYGMEPSFTHMRNSVGCRLDFLWCTDNIKVQALIDPVPQGLEDTIRSQGIPNNVLPSDHVPIGAYLKF